MNVLVNILSKTSKDPILSREIFENKNGFEMSSIGFTKLFIMVDSGSWI